MTMTNLDDIVSSFIEIRLNDPEDFSKIRETLTRIGIASKEGNKLYQTCHILHKRGHYYIVHFLQMFMLDRKETHFNEDDQARLNSIASLLEDWGLLTIINKEAIIEPRTPMRRIKIVKFEDKNRWELIQKYTVGNRK